MKKELLKNTKRSTPLLTAMLSAILAVSLFLCSCGAGSGQGKTEEVEASYMRLVRTEGTVTLTDEEGSDLPLKEDMRLFSGNALMTDADSLAGISLDEVKAATIDEYSFTRVYRKEKKLAMELVNGRMYFSVSEPLADDESFEINTSTMTLGIRGTSGFVNALSETETEIILTSGKALITASDGTTQTIEHGQKVSVRITDQGTEFIVTSITPLDYPAFLRNELQNDPVMLEEVESQNGQSLAASVLAMDAYREIIANADSYEFGGGNGEYASGTYLFAFAAMDQTKNIPALLLRKIPNASLNGESRVRVFQYDPESGSIIAPPYDTLIWDIGHSYHSLRISPDRNGLLYHSCTFFGQVSNDETMYLILRYTLDKDNTPLIVTEEWSETSVDSASHIPANLAGTEISWHEISYLEELGF